jgi:hypothetical protein
MYVAQQFFQIFVFLDKNCPIPPFEQMARSEDFPIEKPRVATGDESHESGEGLYIDLDRHMYMVGHPAIGMEAMPVANECLLNYVFPLIAIFAIDKNGLSTIASQNDMVETARQVEPWSARHRIVSR